MSAKAMNLNPAASLSKKTSARIDPQVADQLLELLATDDVFRQLFKKDPKQALAKAGFVESATKASPAGCLMGITKLASKATIMGSRAELKALLTTGFSMHPVQFNAGTPAVLPKLK